MPCGGACGAAGSSGSRAHLAVDLLRIAAQYEQQQREFIHDACDQVAADEHKQRAEKVGEQQDNAAYQDCNDCDAVQRAEQFFRVKRAEGERIVQLGSCTLVVVRLAHKQEVQRQPACDNDDQRQYGQKIAVKRHAVSGIGISIGVTAEHGFLLIKH